MDAKQLAKLKKWVRQELRRKRITKRQQQAQHSRSRVHVDLDELQEIYDCLEASARDPNEWA
ncbi:MAG TPA: hypothetical protein VHB47_25195 [Thermoanaerobaculia bacterium]|jgi:SRSO17 transposase|nr:hypothetical protein [Thermoanaerobaculia bacterium]